MKCNANTLKGKPCSKNVVSGKTMLVDEKIRYVCNTHFNVEGTTFHCGTTPVKEAVVSENVKCHTCNGAGTIQSGLFLYKCKCCLSKGFMTPADVKRDNYFHEMQGAKHAHSVHQEEMACRPVCDTCGDVMWSKKGDTMLRCLCSDPIVQRDDSGNVIEEKKAVVTKGIVCGRCRKEGKEDIYHPTVADVKACYASK